MDSDASELVAAFALVLGVVAALITIFQFVSGKPTFTEVVRSRSSGAVLALLAVVAPVYVSAIFLQRAHRLDVATTTPAPDASVAVSATPNVTPTRRNEGYEWPASDTPAPVAARTPVELSSGRVDDDGEAHLRRGQKLFDAGNCSAALRECDAGLRLAPESSRLRELRDRIVRSRERGLC